MRTLRTVAVLPAALRAARRAERTGGLVPTMGALQQGQLPLVQRDAPAVRAATANARAEHGVEPEYVELVDPDIFAPVDTLDGRAVLALAARVGGTRLIDSTVLVPPGEQEKR